MSNFNVADFAEHLEIYYEARNNRGANPEEQTEHAYWVALKNLNEAFKNAIKTTLDL